MYSAYGYASHPHRYVIQDLALFDLLENEINEFLSSILLRTFAKDCIKNIATIMHVKLFLEAQTYIAMLQKIVSNIAKTVQLHSQYKLFSDLLKCTSEDPKII